MSLDIIPREAWSRIDPRRIELTTPKRLFAHHTVGGAGVPDRNDDGDTGDDYLRIVERVHILTNGWDDVAYNFFIDPVGLEVYEGQGWGREPNAQKGFNRETWAVAVIGDFRKRHPDDYPGLTERIAELVAYGQRIGELPDVPLEGHRDAPGSEGNTCPGPNLYSALPAINQLVRQPKEEHMFIAAQGTDAHKKHGWPDKGPVVEYYQHLFRRLDASYDPGVGGWGNANSPEFAAELRKYSPGDTVIGPGERAALETLVAERFGKAGSVTVDTEKVEVVRSIRVR